MIDHDALVTRIGTILSTATPPFTVIIGDPYGLPLGGPYAAVTYMGRGDSGSGGMTLGQAMISERWQITCWWPRSPEKQLIEALEVAIADADEALHTAFRADSTLNSLVTYMDVGGSTVNDVAFPQSNNAGAVYRSLQFDLNLDDLEGEAITA